MATYTSLELINKATSLIEQEGGFVNFVRDAGLGGIVMAFVVAIVSGVKDFGTIIFGIPKAVGEGFILLIETIFAGLARIAGSGAREAAQSFATGLASLLGPLAAPAAIGTIMLSVAIVVISLSRLGLNPWSIIFGD